MSDKFTYGFRLVLHGTKSFKHDNINKIDLTVSDKFMY